MNKRIAVALLVLFVATVSFAAQVDVPQGPLTKVESKQVCMINEHHMAKDQIPVDVDGKTYYGCCAMCKKQLEERAETRVAIDPVSGKQVDKAVAVIAAQEDGRVFYFENDKNLEKYNSTAKK
jgi:YHS domain-containing protein